MANRVLRSESQVRHARPTQNKYQNPWITKSSAPTCSVFGNPAFVNAGVSFRLLPGSPSGGHQRLRFDCQLLAESYAPILWAQPMKKISGSYVIGSARAVR
jgi:hypothetical protein